MVLLQESCHAKLDITRRIHRYSPLCCPVKFSSLCVATVGAAKIVLFDAEQLTSVELNILIDEILCVELFVG